MTKKINFVLFKLSIPFMLMGFLMLITPIALVRAEGDVVDFTNQTVNEITLTDTLSSTVDTSTDETKSSDDQSSTADEIINENDSVVAQKNSSLVNEAPLCENVTSEEKTIFSDTTTTMNGNASVIVPPPYHLNWTASIPGANWIWGEHPVTDPTAETIETFTKSFDIVGTPADSTLLISADNSYEVVLNGEALCADPSETNYFEVDTCVITANKLHTGTNTIAFTVRNQAMVGGTQELNPAGLLYKLTINSNSCEVSNVGPVANAGIDQTMTLPTNSTNLDGSLSSDVDGTIVSYVWNFVSGPSAVDPTDIVNPNITGLVEGTYVFQLTVTDDDGAMAMDTVSITVNPAENQCVEGDNLQTIFSDTTTTEGGQPAVAVDPILASWNWVTIPGATWIWGENPVNFVPGENEVETFTKTFNITGNPTDANLMISSDNTYSVSVNGNPLTTCDGTDVSQFLTVDTCIIPANQLHSGSNTITFTVTNINEVQFDDQAHNPAGLIYKLTIGNDCVPPPPVTECSDGVDNADPEDTLIDSLDGGCHTDGNANNSESYDSTDNDETDASTEELTDMCPNIEGVQGEVPHGMNIDHDDNCVDDHRGGSGGGSSGGRASQPVGQVLSATTDTVCNLGVNTYMRVGYRNNPIEVTILENFLNGYMGSNLIADGIYDLNTEMAVRAFQFKHADKILYPWGITESTGIFYKTTLVQAKNLMCPEFQIPVPVVSDQDNWSRNPGIVPPPII